jgi:DHA1 family multidrug resistance protein-like MFS transporter
MDPRIGTINRDILEAERLAEEEVSSDQSRREEDHSYHVPDPLITPRGPLSRRTTTRTRSGTAPLDEVELSRIHTYRLQHRSTVGSSRVVPREQWLELGAGKPYPPSLPEAEEYVVEFVGPKDPLHPHNWYFPRK